MPQPAASKVELSERQEKILTEMYKGTHTPLHFKIRAEIVLNAANGMSNNAIEETMKLSAKKVKRWRDRYGAAHNELQRVEKETPHKLRSAIERTLSDERRPGGPPTYTDEKVAAIIAMACEDPAKFGLPFSHWTPSLLQAEVIKIGILDNISVRQVGRFLKRAGITAPPQPVLAES